jgi:hypothetical protein
MLGAQPGVVKAVLLVLALGAGGAGCYWVRYADLMRTHLDVLTATAGKLCARRAAGQPAPPPAEIAYPLERARDFARVAAKRCPEKRSLAAFHEVLRAYAALVAGAADGHRDCRGGRRLAARVRRAERRLAREGPRCG